MFLANMLFELIPKGHISDTLKYGPRGAEAKIRRQNVFQGGVNAVLWDRPQNTAEIERVVPAMNRFVNADTVIGESRNNLFAYCNYNPLTLLISDAPPYIPESYRTV